MFDTNKYKDLWKYLRGESRPVVLYGGGNGADKVLDRCLELGLEVRGIFASDGFTQKTMYPENDYAVLLCFGSSLPDIIGAVERIAERHELYVPDMPVTDEKEIFDAALCRKNADKLRAARELLADDESRMLYDRLITARLSGSLPALLSAASDECNRWKPFSPESYRAAADLGAYSGDTARELLAVSPRLERLYAFEPDSRTRRRLARTVDELNAEYPSCAIDTVTAAAWSTDGSLAFTAQSRTAAHIARVLTRL